MNRTWMVCAVGTLLSAGSMGCVSRDEYIALERANRALQERNAQLASDLQDAELQLQQKETQIASMEDQLRTKDRTIASLTTQVDDLQRKLDDALGILEKNSDPTSGVVIVKQALPQPLHEKLKELAKLYPDVLTYDERTGSVRWKADLLFPLGSDQIAGSSEAIEALNKFASIVMSEAAAGFEVVIVGHTCTTPIRRAETLAEHKTNWHLSSHRSISVMNLLNEQGVAMTRMGVMGYGEYRPIADNASAQGKELNRRVEIYLVPKESIQAVGQGTVAAKAERGEGG